MTCTLITVGILIGILLAWHDEISSLLETIVEIFQDLGNKLFGNKTSSKTAKEEDTGFERHYNYVLNAIELHSAALIRRKRILSRVNAYGVVDDSLWIREMEQFHDTVVRDADFEYAAKYNCPYMFYDYDSSRPIIELVAARSTDVSSLEATPASWQEFEIRCVDRLLECGWDAQLVGQTGDQGADVIAKKGSVALVVQCKFYSKPVGNSAVQEAVAAKAYYGATHAAVVSRSGYTTSANQLANATDVILLDFSEISIERLQRII